MRVAITGATGFIGSAITRRLAADGFKVSALIRPGSGWSHIRPFVDRLVEGDHADERVWPALLEGADCLIHGSVERTAWEPADSLDLHLQSNLVGSIKLLRASAPRRFILLSSMAVHHDVPQPKPDPGRTFSLPGSYYAAYKSALEAHVFAESLSGRSFAIVRPSSVYGIDRVLSRSRGFDILQSLREGKPFRLPGWSRWVHVDDVAAAVTLLASQHAPSGAFDLVDWYGRHADWALLAAEVLGIQADITSEGPSGPDHPIIPLAARALGISLNRGREGIRIHLAELAALTTP